MDKFKAEVGRVILIGAVAYCGLLTIGLLLGTVWQCELSQPVRDMLVIILTWITTKAGTVVDHQYGGSAGSDAKTQFLMKEAQDAKKKPGISDPAADNGNLAAGVRREPGGDPKPPGTSE